MNTKGYVAEVEANSNNGENAPPNGKGDARPFLIDVRHLFWTPLF
jgi:hypothetical protein